MIFLDRQQSCSMYSLVSDHRLMAEIEEEEKVDGRLLDKHQKALKVDYSFDY